MSRHKYKTIQVNFNLIHLIKHVKSLNPNSLILYLIHIEKPGRSKWEEEKNEQVSFRSIAPMR